MALAMDEIKKTSLIPSSPNAIYAAWMDERKHSAITGYRAMVDQWVGGRVTAYNGKIDATHILLDTGRRIVMRWRLSSFPEEMPDSQVEIRLEPAAGGTKIVIHQTGVPEQFAKEIDEIWETLYLQAMRRFFFKWGCGAQSVT